MKTVTEIPLGLSKDEAFLRLGEPDYASEDGRQIGYGWSKVKMLVLWGSNVGGGAAELKRSYILELSFDDDRRLRSSRMIKTWGESVSPLSELKERE